MSYLSLCIMKYVIMSKQEEYVFYVFMSKKRNTSITSSCLK